MRLNIALLLCSLPVSGDSFSVLPEKASTRAYICGGHRRHQIVVICTVAANLQSQFLAIAADIVVDMSAGICAIVTVAVSKATDIKHIHLHKNCGGGAKGAIAILQLTY